MRPAFLVLTVLYWSINAPRAGGIALGFFAGLALDVFQGPVLGEHALALALVTYIAVREHQRIRSKPAFQQSLFVFAALMVYEFVLFAIDGWTGHPVTSPLRWMHTRDRRAGLAARSSAILGYATGARVTAAHERSPRRSMLALKPCRPCASRITGASSACSTSARWCAPHSWRSR